MTPYWPSLFGGMLLGLSGILLLLINGRIAGISGIVGRLLGGERRAGGGFTGEDRLIHAARMWQANGAGSRGYRSGAAIPVRKGLRPIVVSPHGPRRAPSRDRPPRG